MREKHFLFDEILKNFKPFPISPTLLLGTQFKKKLTKGTHKLIYHL